MELQNRFESAILPSRPFLFSCFAAGVLVAVGGVWVNSVGAEDSPEKLAGLKTVAELTDFEGTADAGQVEAYLRQVASSWDGAELTTIGRTTEGRALWALVVEPKSKIVEGQKPAGDEAAEGEEAGDEGAGDESVPSEAVVTPKPVTALVLGGIHSGECDGKEAILALIRDMAVGKVDPWWHDLRLVFVPNFNADGNERRGVLHRPLQEGPAAGMGERENAQGLDLNRDFIKLESPEVRSLVAALNEYDVDILIDTHTTNGSLHRYELTYDIPHNPATPDSIDSWLRTDFIPGVTERMSESGFSTFYYGNYDAPHQRWETYGHEPRYSTEYMGLRGRIGILSESYSYVPYKTRIDASYAFVREVLKMAAEKQETVRKLIDDAAAEIAPGVLSPIAGTLVRTDESVITKGFQTEDGGTPSPPYGAVALEANEAKDYDVELWNAFEAKATVQLPQAYVLSDQFAWAVSRLLRHGVAVHQLNESLSIAGERFTVTEVEKGREFQGHAMLSTTATMEAAQLELEAGSFVISTAQPLGKLIAYCLEPESDDSLTTWNFFDPEVIVGSLHPVQRITAEIPADLLTLIDTVPATEQLSLEHLMEPGKTVEYSGDAARGARWLKNSSEYVISRSGRFYAIDAETGARRPVSELNGLRSKLASLEAFTDAEASEASKIGVFTDDWDFALVSHKNDLFFYDGKADIVRQLTHSADENEQLAELSPTGKHVAFVRDNDLWVVDCESTELKRLTTNGSVEILNGILDWVYQEELYGRGNFKGFWWSPNGEQVAYLQLDQTPVPEYQVSDSTSFAQTLEATRYPKAGQPLPTANVFVVDVLSGQTNEVNLSAFEPNDRLIGRVSWSPKNDLWLQVFNRVQNRQDLLRIDPTTGTSKVAFTEVSPGWIEIRGVPKFLPSGDFLWLSDLPLGRTHLYRIDSESGSRTQLTRGDWDVASLESVTADYKTAFVTGNLGSPIESHLVAVDIENGTQQAITSAPGTHRVTVDAVGEFFIDVFSSFEAPAYATVHRIDGSLLRVIDAPTSDRFEFLDIRQPLQTTITARDGLEMQALIMLPNDYDMEAPSKPLPVLFYVYGGPQSPTVKNLWGGRNYWWHQLLTQQGFAVVLCDNRSALGRGVKDTWTIRGDMGRVELQDLTDAVEWVKKQPWADAERIGVWGWSYGGYFTSYALTHSELFKAGIAGAPVTDWRNYDAIYTERYMDLPKDNEAGYKSSSTVASAGDLSGSLLIIHGEKDDNVHISNSLQLVNALQEAGKQFELMIYPKNRHGIVDPQQRFHMYRMMTNFLKRELAGE